MRPEMLLYAPFFTAFAVAMLIGPRVIGTLKSRKIGQTIQEDGPESHKPKAGTPTMGGLIILAGFLCGFVVMVRIYDSSFGYVTPRVQSLLAIVVLMFAFAALGWVDDYLTVHPIHGVRGISSKPKAALQVLIAVAFVVWLAACSPEGFVPTLSVGGRSIFGGMLYGAFAVMYIVGMANFINITDGLDGLVSGLSVIASLPLWLVIVLTGDYVANHQGSMDTYALAGFLMAIAGSCLAFLWFNANPAKVFMGDTGSLALGAAFPALGVITHHEVLMMVVGLVFILDGFSTIIQWAVFKYTRIRTGTGRRVFKKSPIHHHFELCGWPEQTVVVRFWICGVIAAALGFAGAVMGLW